MARTTPTSCPAWARPNTLLVFGYIVTRGAGVTQAAATPRNGCTIISGDSGDGGRSEGNTRGAAAAAAARAIARRGAAEKFYEPPRNPTNGNGACRVHNLVLCELENGVCEATVEMGARRHVGPAETCPVRHLLKHTMLLAQCAVALLNHGSDRRHAASSVIDASGDSSTKSPETRLQHPDDSTQHVVYIIGGQSQASGKGLTSELSKEEKDRATALGRRVVVVFPKVDLDPEQLAELLDSLKEGYNSNSALQNDPRVGRTVKIPDDPRIRPGSASLGEIAHGSEGCLFGPEVGFGLRMAEAMPLRKITIIKVTWPGINITMYQQRLYPTVLSALRRFEDAHGKFELGGMLWLQGEADIGNQDADFLSTNRTVRLALLKHRQPNPQPP